MAAWTYGTEPRTLTRQLQRSGRTTSTCERGDLTRCHDLVACWIEPDSVKSGPEEARVKGYGVHVWALLNLLKMYHIDKQAAARACELPDEAIDAVLAYYELHTRALDARVALVSSDDPMPRANGTDTVAVSE